MQEVGGSNPSAPTVKSAIFDRMEDLIKALQIFLKYDNSYAPTGCEHDILRVYVDPEEVSDEDKDKLEELGFDPEEELNCFMSFRFGSA